MLLARALQLFMPGKPQVWYPDLLAGKKDHEAVRRAGEGCHKEINRTNLSPAPLEANLARGVGQGQRSVRTFGTNHRPCTGPGHSLCLEGRRPDCIADRQPQRCLFHRRGSL